MAKDMATLLTTDLHPRGGPEIWPGNQISTSNSTRIPIHTDEDVCPLAIQQFPKPTLLLQNLVSLWDKGFHNWAQILDRAPDGCLYFFEEREPISANPSVNFPLPNNLTYALKYLQAVLASASLAHWQNLRKK